MYNKFHTNVTLIYTHTRYSHVARHIQHITTRHFKRIITIIIIRPTQVYHQTCNMHVPSTKKMTKSPYIVSKQQKYAQQCGRNNETTRKAQRVQKHTPQQTAQTARTQNRTHRYRKPENRTKAETLAQKQSHDAHNCTSTSG